MNNRVDINNVLAEIRNLRSQMQQPQKVEPELSPTQINPTQTTQKVPEFSQVLKSAVNNVNDFQMKAAEMTKAYQAGDPQVDLTEVMIASQKSSVGFQAMVQVRNRVVQAYEDIMNMPV